MTPSTSQIQDGVSREKLGEYDQSLRDRGGIALRISQDAVDAWTPPVTGKRGAQAIYSDFAIETALALWHRSWTS
jgi:hypothetical protein